MSTKFTKRGAPTETQDKIHAWASELQQSSAVGARSVVNSEELTLGEAYQVKFLSLEQIAAGKLLEAAHTNRWRHLVMDGNTALGELELDEAHEPIALHEGMGKDGLRAALKVAEEIPGDYEGHVMTAPALRFIALWLHNGKKDWIIPYAPDATDLVNYVPVSVEDAVTVLQPMAADILGASAGAEPTGG